MPGTPELPLTQTTLSAPDEGAEIGRGPNQA